MTRKLTLTVSILLLLFPWAPGSHAQTIRAFNVLNANPIAVVALADQTLQDDLLNNLVGDWKLSRKMRGQMSESVVHAEWVLNHQFVFLHMRDTATPSQYEARVYLGYDTTSERYVAHWIDIFGGRVSETLGYGNLEGKSIKFTFEYPDGPFHNTMTWHPDTRTWTFAMEQKNQSGKWVDFAEDNLRR